MSAGVIPGPAEDNRRAVAVADRRLPPEQSRSVSGATSAGRAVMSRWCGAYREHCDQTVSVSDHYDDGTYRWWHLSVPSPELLDAVSDGWLAVPGCALDVGCGLGTEAGYLSGIGWRVVGLDLSRPIRASFSPSM